MHCRYDGGEAAQRRGVTRASLPIEVYVMRPVRAIYRCTLLLLAGLVLPNAGQAAEPTFHDLQGNERHFGEFRHKWVLVNYWATWCAPCLEEIPELARFHARHQDRDALVVGVNLEGFDPETLATFMREQGINYPVWTSTPSPRTALGPLSGFPTSFLISPRGQVVARQAGAVSARMIERFIEQYDSATPGS
jgi:thiol-disulfide isomerase/thioredoxin